MGFLDEFEEMEQTFGAVNYEAYLDVSNLPPVEEILNDCARKNSVDLLEIIRDRPLKFIVKQHRDALIEFWDSLPISKSYEPETHLNPALMENKVNYFLYCVKNGTDLDDFEELAISLTMEVDGAFVDNGKSPLGLFDAILDAYGFSKGKLNGFDADQFEEFSVIKKIQESKGLFYILGRRLKYKRDLGFAVVTKEYIKNLSGTSKRKMMSYVYESKTIYRLSVLVRGTLSEHRRLVASLREARQDAHR